MDKSHLTPESRAILSWLVFFGQRENFDRLACAIRNARSALAAVPSTGCAATCGNLADAQSKEPKLPH